MYNIEDIRTFVQLQEYLSNLSDVQKLDSVIAAKCASKFIELFQSLLNTDIQKEKDGLTQNQDDLNKRKKEASLAYNCFNKIASLSIPDTIKADFKKMEPSVKEIEDISNYTAGLNTRMQEILAEANQRNKNNSGCVVVIAFLIISAVCLSLI